ncbi:PREDICTED: carbon catabolite repressor protein 4 homolog 5-like isoform X4 [Camelina sativa]|uniref:Carbon catabolite repressor protein 4 homolog 5-like isoform X4 n=1 Tax=Camelina sativa TaxID=90675 RepID=A0ABM1Q9B3_CAMSA|nr:PREDICTED: carbon catabolite repressor protein 4 homolog 5-like isoform X4 [Camelina sativa]
MQASYVFRRLTVLMISMVFLKIGDFKVFTRFKLLDYQHIEFDRFDMRNNVAQLCVLEMNHKDPKSKLSIRPSDPRRLVVGNIHVLFNPKRGDIKLGQVRLFLEKAYKLSQEWGNIPVAIAGDLNSTPQSAIYDFIASADLDTQLHDRRQISGQSEVEPKKRSFRKRYAVSAAVSASGSLPNAWSKEELQFATGGQASTHVQHQLKLHSAYSGVPGTHRTRDQRGEPLATTYHSRFLGTVDYIWHTKELVPVRVLETLPTDVLTRTCRLPSEKWGSDHLAIACELGFVND